MSIFDRSNAAGVRGERGLPSIGRTLSIQSRLTNVLAMALMLAMGIAFLAWYYMHMASRPARARQVTQAGLADKSRSEMTLPSLGKLEPPALLAMSGADGPSPVPTDLAIPASMPPSGEAPLVAAQPGRLTLLERRLSGAAFAPAGISIEASRSAPSVVEAHDGDDAPHRAAASAVPREAMTALLTADAPRTVAARLLPTQRLLLPKGAFIDCTLETAMDSTLPGLTTCVTASDTFSADGSVVLLERGTKLLGETRGQVQQGSARVFVLWTEARTPTGVVVPLDSPGADELGRSGLPGQVERHFWQRFGAAILISTIDGGVQAAVQSASKGSGTVIYNPSGPQDVMGEVLKNTLNIAPTVIKNNGDRIQILVARDVDFRRVYELRHAISHP
jgi:type IV secretion system protein VirB10